MSQFDGHRWFNPPTPGRIMRVEKGMVSLIDSHLQHRPGRPLSYEVNVKALDSDALFFTGVPEFLRTEAPLIIRTQNDSYRTGLGVSDGMHYFGYSHLGDDSAAASYEVEPLNNAQRAIYLQLPPLDPKIPLLAYEVTAGVRRDEDRAKAIETHLRTRYGYTLELLDEPVDDPLAHFLFVRRKGHCEYFASSMTVMLRMLGIPSRVVTGFQSGTFNPMTGWYIIRASDAHSWVEAYLPKRGWTTFDPTPSGETLAYSSLLARLALYSDAAETFWEEWVLNYNLERQLNLATHVETSTRMAKLNWFDRLFSRRDFHLASLKRPAAILSALLAIGVVLFLYGPAAWQWWLVRRRVGRIRRGQIGASDASILYGRMLSILRRRGFEKPAWLTPIEFARVLPDARTAVLVENLTGAYNELRYGGKPEAGIKMLALLQDLETGA
jgi:transglutaminase-like putative cysteine protease